MIRRALNQKTLRHLPFAEFLVAAKELGCVGVEPRNDLGRPLFDGIAPVAAGEMARAQGLRLLGVSEVYGFNVWSEERAAQIAALIAQAEAAGAETISLIPSVDDRPVRPLRAVMRDIAPMLEGRAVRALIEPIGFESSTLRGKAELVEAIAAVGGPFGLVHDTFQHCIAGETELFPEMTDIVHISGVSRPGVVLDAEQDGKRVSIDAEDRCGTLEQLRAFLAAGYNGAFSFECTEPVLLGAPDVIEKARQSFDYLDAMTS